MQPCSGAGCGPCTFRAPLVHPGDCEASSLPFQLIHPFLCSSPSPGLLHSAPPTPAWRAAPSVLLPLPPPAPALPSAPEPYGTPALPLGTPQPQAMPGHHPRLVLGPQYTGHRVPVCYMNCDRICAAKGVPAYPESPSCPQPPQYLQQEGVCRVSGGCRPPTHSSHPGLGQPESASAAFKQDHSENAT